MATVSVESSPPHAKTEHVLPSLNGHQPSSVKELTKSPLLIITPSQQAGWFRKSYEPPLSSEAIPFLSPTQKELVHLTFTLNEGQPVSLGQLEQNLTYDTTDSSCGMQEIIEQANAELDYSYLSLEVEGRRNQEKTVKLASYTQELPDRPITPEEGFVEVPATGFNLEEHPELVAEESHYLRTYFDVGGDLTRQEFLDNMKDENNPDQPDLDLDALFTNINEKLEGKGFELKHITDERRGKIVRLVGLIPLILPKSPTRVETSPDPTPQDPIPPTDPMPPPLPDHLPPEEENSAPLPPTLPTGQERVILERVTLSPYKDILPAADFDYLATAVRGEIALFPISLGRCAQILYPDLPFEDAIPFIREHHGLVNDILAKNGKRIHVRRPEGETDSRFSVLRFGDIEKDAVIRKKPAPSGKKRVGQPHRNIYMPPAGSDPNSTASYAPIEEKSQTGLQRKIDLVRIGLLGSQQHLISIILGEIKRNGRAERNQVAETLNPSCSPAEALLRYDTTLQQVRVIANVSFVGIDEIFDEETQRTYVEFSRYVPPKHKTSHF